MYVLSFGEESFNHSSPTFLVLLIHVGMPWISPTVHLLKTGHLSESLIQKDYKTSSVNELIERYSSP